ncbi:MAG: YihY/virulence factor BrkB family protein [Chloroflexi bacterium]|nr:YihY/virulence factor BrkB family protein [Chloroflexota bacterium]
MLLLLRVFREMGEDGAGDMAGSIAYFAILSLFPLLLGIIAVLGLFLPSAELQGPLLDFFRDNLPGSTSLLERNIERIIDLRGTLGLLSVIGLFWSGSAIFGAIGRVVNRAWDIHRYRPFYIRKFRDLALAAGTSLLFFISMGITALRVIVARFDLPVLDWLAMIGGEVAAFFIVLLAFLLIYKYMPNTTISWHDIWPGAILASILFELAKFLFVFYLGRFANYELVYGQVASLIILLVWVYFSAFILILGAEFASEYSRWRREHGNAGR